MSNFKYYDKRQLDFAIVWEAFAFWMHGVLRPSHRTFLVISTTYVIAMCEQCERIAAQIRGQK